MGIVAAGIFNSGLLAEARPPDGAKYNYEDAPPELVERARAIAQTRLRGRLMLDFLSLR